MTKLRNRNKTKRRHHVTKRRSHSRRTRSQRGGGWMHTLSFGLLGQPNEPVGTGTGTSSWYEWITGPTVSENYAITDSIKKTIDDADAKVGEAATTAKNVIMDEASALTENATKLISGEEENDTLIGSPYPTPSPSPPSLSPIPVTGGKSRKHNKKGGANLGLLYYATPIKPVSMAGGKKHKHTCCKGKNKSKGKRHSASCLRK